MAIFFFSVLARAAPTAVSTPLPTSAPPCDNKGWDGLSTWVSLGRTEGPLDCEGPLNYREIQSDDAVVLVHPTADLDAVALAAFVRGGGTLAVFDEAGSSEALLRYYGLTRSPLPASPRSMLRSRPAFAIAEGSGTHPLGAEIDGLVTNHATGLSHRNLTELLRVQGIDGSKTALAVAGADGEGRVVFVGDSSTCLNSMVRYAGNREFCQRILRYVRRGRGGRVWVRSEKFAQINAHPEARPSEQMLETLRAWNTDGLPRSFLAALVALFSFALVVSGVAALGRPFRKSVGPRNRTAKPALEAGMTSHADWVASAKNPPNVLVQEWKSALHEWLSERTAIAPSTPFASTLERARERRVLPEAILIRAGRLYADLEFAERMPGLGRRAAETLATQTQALLTQP